MVLMALLFIFYTDVVWAASKQTSLIDTLWKNLHIPTLVFVERDVDMENGQPVEKELTCLDGKQVPSILFRRVFEF